MAENSMRMKLFDGSSDFSMCQVKMRAVLIKEKCYKAVNQEFPSPTSDERKVELDEQAHSEIMIRLTDDAAR